VTAGILILAEFLLYYLHLLLQGLLWEDRSDLSDKLTIVRPLGLRTRELANYCAFLLICTFSIGHYLATIKKSFLVPVGSPNAVVLEIYGDKLIVAPFNRSKKVVQQEYRILTPNSAGDLRWENVGPLQVEKLGK
jgi:hypothetical protein